MNIRLKIICILFSVAYLFVIGDAIYQSVSYKMPSEIQNQLDSTDFYALGYQYGSRAANGEAPGIILGVIAPVTGMILIYLAVIFFLIYVPIQTYKMIRSVIKNNIFDQNNITRMRKIGYALLIVFALNLILYPLTIYLYQNFFGISIGNEIGSIRDDYSFLLTGLLVLLFAEIMKISHTIKEENELTV